MKAKSSNQKNRLNIAIVTAWYPSVKRPLFGVFVQTQAKLISKYANVTVIVLQRSFSTYTRESMDGDLKLIEKGCFFFPNVNEFCLKYWANKYAKAINGFHNDQQFDMVYCHDLHGAYVGYTAHKKYNLPYIVSMHITGIQSGTLPEWKKAFVSKVLEPSRYVFGVGPEMVEVLKKQYGIQQARLLPNFIDVTRFKPKEGQKSISPFRFLYVGALESRKRVMTILEAFYKLQQTDNNVSLYMVGFGDAEKDLLSFIHQKGLGSTVEVLGALSNDKLPDIYASCHCIINISKLESFGVTVIEGMSSGLAVLYSSSGGPEHLVHADGSIEVDGNDVERVVMGMQKVISRYNSLDLKGNRQKVINEFSDEVVVRRLLEYIKT